MEGGRTTTGVGAFGQQCLQHTQVPPIGLGQETVAAHAAQRGVDGQGPVVILQCKLAIDGVVVIVDVAAVDQGVHVVRAQGDGLVQVRQGQVVMALLHVGVGAVVVGL